MSTNRMIQPIKTLHVIKHGFIIQIYLTPKPMHVWIKLLETWTSRYFYTVLSMDTLY